ncbi:MAG: aminotransferase class I/II-fold pyridoxal phosphate-dependent enzyme [Bacteroidales bacterium]|nr:aminotransferase class I/II-fold pyridoxal phosphate-dependent enzyme [Bacteroidales bacterium]
MNSSEFRKHARDLVDWMAWYMDNVGSLPVKSKVSPGEIYSSLPELPPEMPEEFENIFRDFNEIILPGMTHWQSPNFFAYFPANTSPPSILAEMITATMGAQCMIWETSPAAAELEERVLNWLRDNMGLPSGFEGVIQDTASSATLAAIISARERLTGFTFNEEGASTGVLRVYGSTQTHSSVEKGVKIAGLGRKNLIKVATRKDYSLDPAALEKAITDDISNGYKPCCVIATIGTTGTTAIDPLREIGEICNRYNVWLHVDAALGGTALLLPEYQHLADGMEYADSFVFNPHKWMFTNFDCSVYFVRDASHLIRTFEILPDYLKTRTRGRVNDYRDWGVPLGRRFRALKLWMVIRSYGLEGLREKIRFHISLAAMLADLVIAEAGFELIVPPALNTVCFRFVPAGIAPEEYNRLNEKLNHTLNDTGKIYLTHTTLEGKYVLRLVVGQTNVTEQHIREAWNLITKLSREVIDE